MGKSGGGQMSKAEKSKRFDSREVWRAVNGCL